LVQRGEKNSRGTAASCPPTYRVYAMGIGKIWRLYNISYQVGLTDP